MSRPKTRWRWTERFSNGPRLAAKICVLPLAKKFGPGEQKTLIVLNLFIHSFAKQSAPNLNCFALNETREQFPFTMRLNLHPSVFNPSSPLGSFCSFMQHRTKRECDFLSAPVLSLFSDASAPRYFALQKKKQKIQHIYELTQRLLLMKMRFWIFYETRNLSLCCQARPMHIHSRSILVLARHVFADEHDCWLTVKALLVFLLLIPRTPSLHAFLSLFRLCNKMYC